MTSFGVTVLLICSALPAIGCGDDTPERNTDGASAASATNVGGSGGTAALGGSGGGSAAWTYDCDVPDGGPPGCAQGYCVSCLVPARGIPFVQALFYVVDDATRAQPAIRSEPGKACMSGTVSEMATFILAFGEIDATELGITQVGYTIESPPPGGLGPAAGAWGTEIEPTPYLFLDTAPITTSDPVTLALSSLESGFDPTRMVGIQFFLPFHTHTDYDFCVTDVKFLNESGDEVHP